MISNKVDYKHYLVADFKQYGYPYCFGSRIKVLLGFNEELRFIHAMRHLEYCQNVLKCKSLLGRARWICAKHRFRRLSIRLGYSIPSPGLSLPHRGNIIINPKTKIGANCRIHVGVNIGAHRNMAPVIGDNVYIGPGAILFGDIEIANNVTIGANATVCMSVLFENVAVAGTPAKIIKKNVDAWNKNIK